MGLWLHAGQGGAAAAASHRRCRPGVRPRSLAFAPRPLAVVGVEEPLLGADPHGPVGVQQQLGEAGGEVPHKAVRDGAQGCPDVGWQLVVVMLLQERGRGEWGWGRWAAGVQGSRGGRTLFLMARRRSRTEPPL